MAHAFPWSKVFFSLSWMFWIKKWGAYGYRDFSGTESIPLNFWSTQLVVGIISKTVGTCHMWRWNLWFLSLTIFHAFPASKKILPVLDENEKSLFTKYRTDSFLNAQICECHRRQKFYFIGKFALVTSILSSLIRDWCKRWETEKSADGKALLTRSSQKYIKSNCKITESIKIVIQSEKWIFGCDIDSANFKLILWEEVSHESSFFIRCGAKQFSYSVEVNRMRHKSWPVSDRRCFVN